MSSRGVQGSLGVHGKCLSFSLSLSLSILHTLDSRFCLAARGPRLNVSESVTLVPSHLQGTGGEARRRGEKTRRGRARCGTAGCWRLFHRLFISLVVKFIYQLSILCFVSLLYAQYKVTINSICGYKKCLSKVLPHILLSSSDTDTFKFCFCEHLYKDLVQI